MIKVYPYDSLGHASHGWLEARHHFSFSSYYDPKKMNFGVLRVINDDIIQAGTGFDTHPHRDMEIITYVRQGAITHRDSQGNEGRTTAGNVQVMSAGSGIFHSEYNHENEETRLYQIWIEPDKKDLNPSWKSEEFSKEVRHSSLKTLVSGDGSAPLFIHQDARIDVGVLEQGAEIVHPIKHQAYVLVSEGEIDLDGHRVKKGDGAAVTDQKSIHIKAVTTAEVLVIDVPERQAGE